MKQVYKCDYCGITGSKATISNHEWKCVLNPKVKMCFTCKHFDMIDNNNIDIKMALCNSGGSPEKHTEFAGCKKYEEFIKG